VGIGWLDDAVMSFFFSQQNSLIGGDWSHGIL